MNEAAAPATAELWWLGSRFTLWPLFMCLMSILFVSKSSKSYLYRLSANVTAPPPFRFLMPS